VFVKFQIPRTRSYRPISIDRLKQTVALTDIIAQALEHDAETVRGEQRWTCWRHPDVHPSLWAYDDYRGTGVGRWGCNPCGISGDVFDFLKELHGLDMREAIDWVQKRRRIRVCLRQRSGRRS
jgi:DNA primase